MLRLALEFESERGGSQAHRAPGKAMVNA
jgi:hypothetical protein